MADMNKIHVDVDGDTADLSEISDVESVNNE